MPLLCFIAPFLLSLIGCTPSSPPSKTAPFVIAIESSPTQLDPRFATDAYSERIGQLLFSRLIRFDPSGEIVSDLAERWEIRSETEYLFYLKKNVTFHDGRPVTSDDVRYTYESLLDPRSGTPHRRLTEIIDRIEAPDPGTVRFHLRKPYAPFLTEMTKGIVPRHLAEFDPARFSSRPVGSGPFSLVRNQPDEGVELAAYAGYFEGAPSLPHLHFRIIPDDSVRLLELEKGNIDLIQNAFPPDALPRLQANPTLKVLHAPGTTYSYIGFNLKDPFLKMTNVRAAIAFAVNREEITRHIFKDLARPADGLLPSSHWAYTSAAKRYRYDPDRAGRLLDQAGFPDPPGPSPRFKLIHKTSQNELARRVVEVLQRQLGQVGIDLEIRSYEWGTFFADIKAGNFQLFTLSWVGIQDPDMYYNIFHSGGIPPNGSNRGRYENRALDRLVEEGRVTLDPIKRKALYEEVQKIVSEELPYVSLWHLDNVAVMKKEVSGYILYPDGDFYSLTKTDRSGAR